MSEKKIQFTLSMRDHLVNQGDYYAPLTKAVEASNSRYLVRTQDVSVTEKPLANGNVQVRVSFPIDDNKTAADGQIQLHDTFVLSPDGRRVHSFDRQFRYNQKGPSILWQTRLAEFRKAAFPSSATQQRFVDQVLNKPLVLARLKASTAALEFMRDSGLAIQNGLKDDQMQILAPNPGSFMTMEKAGKGFNVKFIWVVDNDGDSQNGRYIMEDVFFLGENGKTLKKHQRQWRGHPESRADGDQFPLAQFYGVGKPSKAKAQAFIEAVLPAIFRNSETFAPVPVSPQGPAGSLEERRGVKRGVEELGGMTIIPTESSGSRGPSLNLPPAPYVQPPVVTASPASGAGKGRPIASFEFSFAEPGMKARNANAANASGHIQRAIGAYLKSQLGKRGVSGSAKLNFNITFGKDTGYVTKVEIIVLQDKGLGLNGKGLEALLRGAATRIHQSMRADASAAGVTMQSPVTTIIQ